jgi:hypothetical protein
VEEDIGDIVNGSGFKEELRIDHERDGLKGAVKNAMVIQVGIFCKCQRDIPKVFKEFQWPDD